MLEAHDTIGDWSAVTKTSALFLSQHFSFDVKTSNILASECFWMSMEGDLHRNFDSFTK